MSKFNVLALANTFAIIDLILHLAFHVWGWYFPKSLESVMSEFVIGLDLNINETFTFKFIIFWILEALAFWSLGASIAVLHNKLAKK